MKSIYVADLVKNQNIINETFVIFECEKMEDKNGKAYYNIILGDKTGKIPSKLWSDKVTSVDISALKKDIVVQISGKVDEYKAALQLTLNEMHKIDESALEEFLESSEFNVEEMMSALERFIDNIKDASIKKVIKSILTDEDIRRRYKFWPAATTIHHDFRSGLLQHVLEMLNISESLPKYYLDVNYDILKAGIILHDIGKIYELDASGAATKYTTIGTLMGHITIGMQLFTKYAKEELETSIYMHIMHLIASHHGQLAFGSPVLPATVEAMMLTQIDNLSSKSRTAHKARKNIAKGQEFSSYIPWLEGARMWRGPENDNPSVSSDTNIQPKTNRSIDDEDKPVFDTSDNIFPQLPL